MVGLDTNILARYYIDDSTDVEAKHQRPVAQRLIDSGQPLSVCKTVIVELEWLMRASYHMKRLEVLIVFRHLLSLTHLTIEERPVFIQALANYESGIAFADALHHASYLDCDAVASFDDRKFARRAAGLKLHPPVVVPQ